MPCVVLISALLALRGTAALKFSQDPPVASAAAHADELPLGAVEPKRRQVMYNHQDLQYSALLTIGGQRIAGLLDTGSFDLVVFDKVCMTCGKATKYSSKASQSFTAGVLTQSIYYGSGSVDVVEGSDQVAIGPYGPINLTFWDVTDAMMPFLQNAAFNALVGVGPPETPGADTWSVVQRDIHGVMDGLETGPDFPASSSIDILRGDVALATAVGTRPTLIKADDVARFSICLGQKPGSVGYFTWNDTHYLDTPSLFTRVKVLGHHTWTMNMTSLQLNLGGRGSDVISCDGGCGAIIDSGTSLILMPYHSIKLLRQVLQTMSIDCNNIQSLPKMTFKLDGKEFALPPDAYISKRSPDYTENENAATSSFHGERVRLDIGGGGCELAVMGSSSATNWGPLWILGMPFFRTYYTTFVMGRNHDERAIFVAPASRNCTPANSDSDLSRNLGHEHELRTVNHSAMLIPRIVHRAETQAILGDL